MNHHNNNNDNNDDTQSIDSVYNQQQHDEEEEEEQHQHHHHSRAASQHSSHHHHQHISSYESAAAAAADDDADDLLLDDASEDAEDDDDDLLSNMEDDDDDDSRSHFTSATNGTTTDGRNINLNSITSTAADDDISSSHHHGALQQDSSYGNLLRQQDPNDNSFYSMYGGTNTDIDYSDADTFSIDEERNEESFLVDQQKKVAFDFKRQEEHENALKDMYEYMKRAGRKKKVAKKVKSLFGRMMRRTSDWILSPDKFWSDVVYVVFTYFQIAGLLWIFPYVMPPNVYTFTQWTIYSNFDFISHRDGHPNLVSFGLENPPFYPFYLTPWLLIPPLLFTFWLVMPWFRSAPIIRRWYYELDRIIFTLLRILYLPFLLHTVAAGFCGSKGQSAFQCAAFCPEEFGWCLTRSLPAFIGGVYYGLGVPISFCYYARKLIVYTRNIKHMNYMANVEVEKSLHISNNYVIYRLYMISSYTRLGSYYVFIKEAIQKGTLVVIWAVLDGRDNSGVYSWRSQVAISSFAFAVMVLPLIVELFWRPYRNLTYLMLTQMLGWVHVFNVMLAWFLALNVKSPFLLASQLTILILMVNATVLVVVFGMLTVMILMRVKWPINDRVVKELETKYSHYLRSIRNGYMLYAHALTTNSSFVRCDLIDYHKEYLQKLYQEAVLENNPLEETIEDCILKLEEEYYANQNLTIMPHRGLQQCLPSLRRNMDRRQTEMILIPPRKRILLLKILALRKIIGNQPLRRVKIGEAAPEPDDLTEDTDAKSEESFDLSSMDKLQAFLAQYHIHLSDDEEEEEPAQSDKEDDDDIDRLLDEASDESGEDKSEDPREGSTTSNNNPFQDENGMNPSQRQSQEDLLQFDSAHEEQPRVEQQDEEEEENGEEYLLSEDSDQESQ